MSRAEYLSDRGTRFLNRYYARLSSRQKAATGFVSQPEPRTIGSFARGRQLIGGNLMLAGSLVEAPGTSIWQVAAPDVGFDAERHGFGWLDDLAAVGDAQARQTAQHWLSDWITLHGRGRGPGWTPDLTGRRIVRWINHAIFLLRGMEPEHSHRFYRALARQTWFLNKRWKAASPGLARFEALAGLVFAGLSLEGMEDLTAPALSALETDCAQQIDAQGGLPTRNPEELLDAFMLLTWIVAALTEAGRDVPAQLAGAVARIAPTLRTLRHADGGLARFHGGGRGLEGRLDHALAASRVTTAQAEGLAMGYARLSAGRSSVIIDAARPPSGNASANAHASTLAFELTSGRRPLIVNCGSGAVFGAEWRRAGRATPSHSALCLDGLSNAKLAQPARHTGREMLLNGPRNVPVELSQTTDYRRFSGGQDGYVSGYGLTVARQLDLSRDGRDLSGEDMVLAIDDAAKKRFDSAMDAVKLAGIPFDIRFHLHPDVDATLDLGGSAVSMALKSGEVWVLRHDGQAVLDLQPSVYLEFGRLKPRETKQIVLSGRAIEYATRIRWSLSKAHDTAIAVRDLNRDDADLFDPA